MNVRDIQCLLTFLKRSDGTSYYTGEVDNIWGPLSKKAVRDFQSDFGGLNTTGEADEATEKAMRHAVAYGIPEREEPEPDTDVGSTGDDFWPKIKYFTKNEPRIACPCGKCGGFPVEPVERLMLNADATREHFGRPMIPSSTVRCAAHNASLKGSAANSLHMRGKAMDFAIPGVSANTIVAYVKTLPDVDECYAIDASYVHMGVLKYD